MIVASQNGSVELNYDNVKKAETTANGFFVTGSLWADGLYLDDNEKIHLGTSGADFDIYHAGGTTNKIESGSNTLYVAADDLQITNGAITEACIKTFANGAAELYYDNSKKFNTDSGGAQVYGILRFDDGGTTTNHINFGNSADLKIYHGGTHSYIYESGGGNLVLRTAQGTYSSVVLQAGAENSVACYKNGGVDIFYDSVKKFETNSAGTAVTGQQVFTNTGVASAYIGANSDGGVFGSDTAGLVFKTGVTGGGSVASTGTVRMQIHNSQFTSFGTGGDTIIYNHGLSDSYVGGVVLDAYGSVQAARHNDQCLLLKRIGTYGTVSSFYNDWNYVWVNGFSGGTTVYATSSDYRLKENVVTLSNAIKRNKK